MPCHRVSPGGKRVELHFRIEDADLKNIPAFLDRSIVDHINTRLDEKPDAVSWSFAQTFALRIPLPASMSPLEQFIMDAQDFAFEIDATALRVSIDLPMHFSRRMS